MSSLKALLMSLFVGAAGFGAAAVLLPKHETKSIPAQPASAPVAVQVQPASAPVKVAAEKQTPKGPSVFVCQERVNNCKIRCKNSARGWAGAQEQYYACSQQCIARGCNNR